MASFQKTVFSLVAALGLTACGDDGGGGGSGGSGTATTTAGATVTMGMTSTPTSTTTTAGGSGGTSMGSTGITPGPDGAMCEEDFECISGKCFFIFGVGGLCGECLVDEDCADGGCSVPNPLAMPPIGSRCNMGEPGAGCMSDAVCMGTQVCATIIDLDPIFVASGCSECLDDAACMAGQFCSITYDIQNISGERRCHDPGTQPNGQGCDLMGGGDAACMSGFCATVSIPDFMLTVGICGECNVDADCPMMGDVCSAADVDIETGVITPPLCGPPA